MVQEHLLGGTFVNRYLRHDKKNTSLFTGGSLTHKTSAGARTGIVRCPDGHRPIC